MKRVFVTGASSELMRSVLADFPKEAYQVVALSRKKKKDEENLSWIQGDLNNPASYETRLADLDLIIHAAAITHSRDADQYHKVNVKGTQELIKAALKKGEPRFVFISSRTATEESGAYGVSKLKAEQAVKSMTENWLIIRPAEVFGGAKAEGVDGAITSAISGGVNPCPVGLSSKMYPIHSKDAAKAISKAVLEDSSKNKLVYVNGPDALSFKELLQLVEKETGRKVWVLPIPKFVMNMAALVSTVLNIDLGFVPDQVDRLYSYKQEGPPSPITISLSHYIKEKLRNEN